MSKWWDNILVNIYIQWYRTNNKSAGSQELYNSMNLETDNKLKVGS